MYCQGTESGVKDWVSTLVKKPAEKLFDDGIKQEQKVPYGKLEEIETVKEYGATMEALGVRSWWRRGMGYMGET
ncbi:hypothetical protein SNOG_07657 [Parastagonospora nodorum SN15]|uniref:Uncharacterized protein n=1 Tax=Phaeosphaeria nodorum (strain SN15 / ATCC MYA-4574 / FGSC 10173) TaxID=321614 RepID=Q0UKQ7_PHANO|nr:hypothetical protein SNOG_07657 [Parastagonospora nodorum SN15]EAT85123.1 hypothetical protein SNOG_07657 [Parastagonospora nodorum SN15]